MALISIRPLQSVRIPPLLVHIDGYPHHEHEIRAETTELPLETGAQATDHAVTLPTELNVTALVANTIFATGLRPRLAWEAIQRIHRERITVSVTTPWGSYDDMILVKGAAVPWGLGMQANLEFRQLRFVEIADTEVSSETSSGPAEGRPATVERGRAAAVPV